MMNRLNVEATRKAGIVLILTCSYWLQACAQPCVPNKKLQGFGTNLVSCVLKWKKPEEPTKIIGPIYFVGTKGLGSYLITTSEGHFLLNTGMPGSGPMIESSIKKLGFKPTEIKYLLTSHAHVDHAGGHAHMKDVSKAKVLILAEEKELLESGGKNDFIYSQVPQFWFPPVKADQELQSGEQLTLGNVTLTARLTPGHTKGSCTWTTTVVDNGKTYRVVFPDGTGINPGYRLEENPCYPGIKENYCQSLNWLAALKPTPAIWLTGHTGDFNFKKKKKKAAKGDTNAWIDSVGYHRWLLKERAKFNKKTKNSTSCKAK